ncbi:MULTISPECIES: HPr family phosphocarrier protein [unclassified Azospirillum]|uniref:HPr family phosphocarrier protein n=1 Tax=unclassified Azospirillum TaxID=2630922 RepID=UPI000B6B98BB|nr:MULTISPECIES: HPr family phosphocarrier protein [unclassified Azospirillum]SNR88804.1 phosphocarrier protein [Azospirillum sp. RU38E]SNS04943.1 phosphocarrier protein [Azospirillum sp. RU37A]
MSLLPPDALKQTVTIRNRRGLHARAAAKFVRLAGEYDAQVEVVRGDTEVSGVSIMGLMMLAASIDTQIEILAAGRQAQEVMDALVQLVADKFGED